RTQMLAEDQERFEAAAGDLLDELGYPRAVPQPRPEAVDRASQVRESFIRDLTAYEPVLPRRWGEVSMNPFVFIVGCPRSGTTLLQRLVDAHPQLAIIHETHWIPKFYQKATQESPEARVTPELLKQLRKHSKFEHLGIPGEELQSWLGPAESV